MAIKWKVSKLAQKYFILGFIINLVYSSILYVSIYNGIPIIYRWYKLNNLTQETQLILQKSENLIELQFNIAKLQEKSNIMVYFEYNQKVYECDFRNSGCQTYSFESKNDESILNSEYFMSVVKESEIGNDIITFNFITPISSTAEVQRILIWFLPLFMLLAAFFSMLTAYLISTRMSKRIIKINEDAKKIKVLNFEVNEEIEMSDEIGELSNSLNEMAQTLKETLENLQQANEKLSDDIEKERKQEIERRANIAMLSHDLKTPLTIIRGQSEGMLYQIGKYKDYDKYLKNNISLANDMEGIIQTIILSSKLDDPETKIHKNKESLFNIIQDIIDELEYQIEDNNLEIELSIPMDQMVYVDKNMFTRALINLIENSLKYSVKDSSIKISFDGKKLLISNVVESEKIDLDNLFKPFYRADTARTKKGSGLGLYIVKRICDLHGFDVKISVVDMRFMVVIRMDEGEK